MAKRKLHHLHKIKIHHNRWLIWAISYALIVTVALVGYIKVSDLNLEGEPQSNFESWRGYRDSVLGFGLRYPGSWAIEADSDTSVSFLPSENSDIGINIAVLPLSAESSVRRALKIVSESPVELSSRTATKIVNDLGEAQETLIMVKHRNQLYVLRGSEGHVTSIAETFYFLK